MRFVFIPLFICLLSSTVIYACCMSEPNPRLRAYVEPHPFEECYSRSCPSLQQVPGFRCRCSSPSPTDCCSFWLEGCCGGCASMWSCSLIQTAYKQHDEGCCCCPMWLDLGVASVTEAVCCPVRAVMTPFLTVIGCAIPFLGREAFVAFGAVGRDAFPLGEPTGLSKDDSDTDN